MANVDRRRTLSTLKSTVTFLLPASFIIVSILLYTFRSVETGPLVGVLSRRSDAPTVTDVTAWHVSIMQSVHTSQTRAVYFSVSDSSYSKRFNELLKVSSAHFAPVPLVMSALDTYTYEYFARAGVPVIFVDQGTVFEGVEYTKLNLVLGLLQLGLSVYFSEMDVYWQCLPQLDYSKDFIASQHKYAPHGEINIGFFFARPVPNVVLMFSNLATWSEKLHNRLQTSSCNGVDQKVIDLSVRGSESNNAFIDEEVKSCHLSPDEIELLTRTSVDWGYLSHDILEHWPIENIQTVCGVHVWSGSGSSEEQFQWIQKNFLKNETKLRV